MSPDSRIFNDWKRSAHNRLSDATGLMVFGPSIPAPDFESVFEHADGPVLRLESGSDSKRLRWNRVPVAIANCQSLPFQTGSLGLVLLNHVIATGREPELDEACRVLKPGGVLLVLGLNRYGFLHFGGRNQGDVPGLRPLAVREQLEGNDMSVETMLAAGVLGRQRPSELNQGFWRFLKPVADSILIVARKNEPRLAAPLKPARLRAVRAPSALAGP